MGAADDARKADYCTEALGTVILVTVDGGRFG